MVVVVVPATLRASILVEAVVMLVVRVPGAHVLSFWGTAVVGVS